MDKAFKAALAVLAVLLAAACLPSRGGRDAAPALVFTPANVEYTLGAGDRVLVTVFGHEDLSGEFTVDGRGQVSLPLIGGVPTMGQTSDQLATAVETKLRAGYLSAPRVTVEVLEYRPYYILGEVNDPGSFPFIDGLTVNQAVATAGGFTFRADVRRVFVRRAGEFNELETPLTASTPVLPGDTIRIPDRRF